MFFMVFFDGCLLDFLWLFDGFLMGFKFWGAAPGGFFENPMIFNVLGLKIQEI